MLHAQFYERPAEGFTPSLGRSKETELIVVPLCLAVLAMDGLNQSLCILDRERVAFRTALLLESCALQPCRWRLEPRASGGRAQYDYKECCDPCYLQGIRSNFGNKGSIASHS